ncbi:MAG: HAMP domain-containing histidine kinase [Candidatus Competibacteraceae bacterium]|nr:HAMP domain-containing histidine kinase [Candidatus Competibacteraceae bacterium]
MANEPLYSSPPVGERRIRRRFFQDSLSVRMLVVVLAVVMTGGILIHIPSILIYHRAYLEHRISDANIAVAALAALDDPMLDARREQALLDQVGVTGIEVVSTPTEAGLKMGRFGAVKTVADGHSQGYSGLLGETLTVLFSPTSRLLHIVGAPATQPERVLIIEFNDSHLKQELRGYSLHHVSLTLLISLFTALLVYASLERLMVRPIHRITALLVKFRQNPEAEASIIQTSRRRDEIGVMERELVRMQAELRAALTQQARFATIGRAVSRIHHDLNSILSTVSLTSERLTRIHDPATGRIAQLLARSVEKAIDLCTQTQDLARGETPVPAKTTFLLFPLVAEVGEMLQLGRAHPIRWRNDIAPDFSVTADRERLYRVFLNLGKNALEALTSGGEIRITVRQTAGQAVIDIRDTGPGIPETTLGSLFIPFTTSGRTGGTGLGLATARDLMRAHGGELSLVETGSHGTCFRLTLPLSTP